jgi:hypothetical protein
MNRIPTNWGSAEGASAGMQIRSAKNSSEVYQADPIALEQFVQKEELCSELVSIATENNCDGARGCFVNEVENGSPLTESGWPDRLFFKWKMLCDAID